MTKKIEYIKINNRLVRLLRIYRRFENKVKYGLNAPVHREHIWINPADCNLYLEPSVINKMFNCTSVRDTSGRVIVSAWPDSFAYPVDDFVKINYCIKHWVEGQPWEQAGAYEYMISLIKKKGEVDGCKNIKDIIKRYDNLDKIYSMVKKERKLRDAKNIDDDLHRLGGEPIIHIGPEGILYFSGAGSHRFAMARIIRLPLIEAELGCIHASAIQHLQIYRQNKRP